MSDDKVVPLARSKRGCPICGRAAAVRHRPFCSARCADIDLGRWFSGRYGIPGEAAPLDGTSPDEAPPEDEER
jgi:endogenous inhibitor of DNA gyrase (YacG/DUF329 family)